MQVTATTRLSKRAESIFRTPSQATEILNLRRKAAVKHSKGIILWRGKSTLTGDPIVVVAIRTTGKKSNRKTGPAVQVYILRDNYLPLDAVRSGKDEAICGSCPLRGDGLTARLCYVNVGHGPSAVYRKLKRGGYPRATAAEAAEFVRYRFVRFGAYGDPAAVPLDVWTPLLATAGGWTGYTHQWRSCDRGFSRFLMASVETRGDAARAKALGYRTFRVRTPDDVPTAREVVCPASAEAGHRRTCGQCRLCCGTHRQAKDVVIAIHHAPFMQKYVERTYTAKLVSLGTTRLARP
jgi:hypothetical protein